MPTTHLPTDVLFGHLLGAFFTSILDAEELLTVEIIRLPG